MLNTYSDGDVLSAAELNSDNTEIAAKLVTSANDVRLIMPTASGAGGYGFVKWTDTRWQHTNGSTDDSGTTWDSVGYGASSYAATSDGINGVAVNFNSGASTITADAGLTCTASTPSITHISTVTLIGIQLFDTSNGIAWGGASTGSGVWYTSDGGDTWTQGSSIVPQVVAATMASATICYAIDNNDDIWRSTNGGSTWTDTTDDWNLSAGGSRMFATDVDTIYFSQGDSGDTIKYTYSTNTFKRIILNVYGNLYDSCIGNWVKGSGTKWYAVYFSLINSSGINGHLVLYTIDTSNDFAYARVLPIANASDASDFITGAADYHMYNICLYAAGSVVTNYTYQVHKYDVD